MERKPAHSLEVAQLSQMLEIAMNALMFYKEHQTYFYQSSTSGYGTACSDVAEAAINQIRELKGNQ